jgi:hypothetical protein
MAPQLGVVVAKQDPGELVLAFVVAVERALGDPCRFRDIANRRLLDAFLGEQAERGPIDLLPCLGTVSHGNLVK